MTDEPAGSGNKIVVMKCLLLTALICVPVLFAQNPNALIPGPGAFVDSPEVHADGRVTFRLRAPEVSSVTVQGEFAAAPLAMTKDDKGVWSVTTGPIAPEIYNYNFVIDGVRTIDVNNPRVKSGSTPNTIQSILEVRGDKPAFYDGRPVPHGSVDERWYESKSLHSLRRIRVYLPPGYDGNQTRYPVLYLLHGANLDENAWVRLGHANLILDNLLAEGKSRPFIVVMPFGYGIPPGEASRGGAAANMDAFRRDLTGDVIPYVDAKYRTLADRDHRGIAGLSMGGGQSLTIGLNRLDLFSYVIGMSAGIRNTDGWQAFSKFAAEPQAANAKLRLLWIGCGTADSLYKPNQEFSQFLSQHGIHHEFHSSGGAHTFMVWRHYLNDVAPLLFR